jgi:hypothetical protein
MEPTVAALLGLAEETSEEEVMTAWIEASVKARKPCWRLGYCPYGPLVEDFPLLPPTRADAEGHMAYLRGCLETGVLEDGEALEPERRALMEELVAGFDASRYPENNLPLEITRMECSVFGHICPVVFSAEPFIDDTEPTDPPAG